MTSHVGIVVPGLHSMIISIEEASHRCSQRGSVEFDLAVRREGWGRGESFRQREEQEDMTVVLGVTHGEQEDEGWKAH